MKRTKKKDTKNPGFRILAISDSIFLALLPFAYFVITLDLL